MSITFGDRLIDSGYYDITPEQEREIEAREECERRGIDPDEVCADGGVLAWMIVDQQTRGCPVCGGDCAAANPPVLSCPVQEANALLSGETGRRTLVVAGKPAGGRCHPRTREESGVTKHLWEVDHPYYCREEAWNSGEGSVHHDLWATFEEEFRDADFDMNLLFRFDWVEGTDHGAAPFNGDVYYRNGIFKAFWIGQRKGMFWCNTVAVCRADEPAVLDFLRPRLDHLLRLWEPISRPTPPPQPREALT